MKRTRRVEVTRYSWRSTLIQNDAALRSDLTAEQAAIDVLSRIPVTIESTGEQTGDAAQQLSDAGGPDVVQRRRPLNFLKRLIQASSPSRKQSGKKRMKKHDE